MCIIFNDLHETSCGNSWDWDEILLQRIFLMRSMNAGSLLQLFTENCWHTRLSWSHWHYTNRWQHYVNQRTIILMGEQWTLNVWPQLLMNDNVWSSVGSTLKVLFKIVLRDFSNVRKNWNDNTICIFYEEEMQSFALVYPNNKYQICGILLFVFLIILQT